MRKTLRGMLCLFLILFLCGCQMPNGDRIAQPESGPYAVVEVTINPEIELHVDTEGRVRAVICKNDDAREVSDGLEYMGVPFEIYLSAFLEQCVQQGYLNDGGQVLLTLGGEMTLHQEEILHEQADEILAKCAASGKINISAQVETPSRGAVLSDYTATYVPPNAQKEYDNQGKLIGYREVQPDGTILEVVLNAQGNIQKETISQPDGLLSEKTYDDQGNIIHIRETGADGTEVECRIDASGSLVETMRIAPDGSGRITGLNDQGMQESFVEYGPGGTVLVQWSRVYSSADPWTYIQTDMDGTVTEGICGANGITTYSRMEDLSQFIRENWYDPSTGELTRWKITEPDGLTVETIFQDGVHMSETWRLPDGVRMDRTYADGIPVVDVWQSPDGEVWKDIYADGEIVESLGTMADGTVWSRQYSAGALVYFRRDAPDGSYWEERYSGGNRIYEASYNAALNTGSANTYTYNPNGTLAFVYTENADGSIFEVTHDQNGNPVSWKLTDASGVQTQGGFNAAGQPID